MTVAALLDARRRRQRWILVACAIVVVAAGGVLAAVTLGDDSESSASTDSAVVSQVASEAPATTPPVLPATAATVATVATVATAIPTVVPATAAPATAAPGTTATDPVVTTAPATSLLPPPTPSPSPTEGDLGLSTPITRPSCEGQYITLIGASVDPSRYSAQIGALLSQYPGAKYLKTELVCTSLRARTTAGNAIYVLYFGPFATKPEACAARANGPDDAYVKLLDNTSDPTVTVDC